MFQIGETYKMKTYVHDFLDFVTVVDIYTGHGTTMYEFVRPNGQKYTMSSLELVAVDYYRVASSLIDDMTDNEYDASLVTMTDNMTDNEYDSLNDVSLNYMTDAGVFDPNEIFIDFDYEPPQM